MEQLPDKYNPREAEPRTVEFWEGKKVFAFNPDGKGEVFSVDTPPPTVSGKMHIGHSFSYTQQDIIVRYKRMKGLRIFYPFGTDDNGLPTERLIEKLKGVKGTQMERQAFIELCEKTLKEIRPGFVHDWKRIGISCDFSLFYSTIDKRCQKMSQAGFLELVKKGRAYRKEAPALWCPLCETAISQVECRDELRDTMFNDVVFRAEGKDIIIATTRPELLGACVAVFAHPDDERYKSLFGKKATVPLYNYNVPIMPDARADPTKGTGIVMCCTFGDQTDMEWFLQHNLPLREAIGKNGKMTALSGKYAGMSIDTCKKAVIEDLKAAGLLKKQTPLAHEVRVHERCGTPVEIIKSKQWFIRYLDLKEDMLKWGAELKWYPEFMKSRYDNWVRGLQWDWLISRQRFFGIPFPVWYCKKCDSPTFADEKSLPCDPLKSSPTNKCPCGSSEFEPEKDIIDTWATSSLTPQIAISLVDEKHRKQLFPMSMRPQAHDIITFWLFNTVVRSRLSFGMNPWKDTVISGFVTMEGEKMSKSKGNIVEPQEVCEKYSADALRYWASSSKFGDDLAYYEKDVRTGDKFVIKLWNATRFAASHIEDYGAKSPVSDVSEPLDKWALVKLSHAISSATDSFEKYDYSHAKAAIEKFFWQDFCDNYLELVKGRLYESVSAKQKRSAQAALYLCLSNLLRLWSPFTPFITEELYQLVMRKHEDSVSVHLAKWPEPILQDSAIEEAGDAIISALAEVRTQKSQRKLSMKAPVKKVCITSEAQLSGFISDFKNAACAAEVELKKGSRSVAAEF